MNEQEIQEYLKNKLKLSYEVTGGSYGSNVIKEVKLLLDGEEISSIYIED